MKETEKENVFWYLVRWEGSYLLTGAGVKTGWQKTDKSCPITLQPYFWEEEKLFHPDLSIVCVWQKSFSGSNLSRSASVAYTNSILFHPAALCWRTQHLSWTMADWSTGLLWKSNKCKAMSKNWLYSTEVMISFHTYEHHTLIVCVCVCVSVFYYIDI